MANRFMSLRQTIRLPELRQGGTLSIRTTGSPARRLSPSVGAEQRRLAPIDVRIVPQWRDDAELVLRQDMPISDGECLPPDAAYATSDDRFMMSLVDQGIGGKEVGGSMLGNGSGRVSVVLDDRDSFQSSALRDGIYHDVPHVSDDGSHGFPIATLTAYVPEKLNVDCRLQRPGDITIDGKMEGERGFDLFTANGNVSVKKLRGDAVSIKAHGAIHVNNLLEAQTVHLVATSDNGRLRAKMVNGTDVRIQVPQMLHGNADATARIALDEDDSFALIDIGSLYTSNQGDGAVLEVSRPCGAHHLPRSVRVKSSHGYVSVAAKMAGGASAANVDDCGQRIPIVEISGANGSCDVSVEQIDDYGVLGGNEAKSARAGDSALAARIHVDSLAPDSVSVITTNGGDVELTVDRKVESDLRLLSCRPNSLSHLNLEALLSEDKVEVREEILRLNKSIDTSGTDPRSVAENKKRSNICIQTRAFRALDSILFAPLATVEYVEGRMENKSFEPDSRFDVKTKPINRGIGKVNVDGAAAQALSGFSGSDGGSRGGGLHDQTPLLAVATTDRIRVETVSWFGAIARRYGMEDRGREDIGRTAKRIPRLK